VVPFAKNFDQPVALHRATGTWATVAAGGGRVYCAFDETLVIIDQASVARTSVTVSQGIYQLAIDGDTVWVVTAPARYQSKLWRVTSGAGGVRAEEAAALSPRLNSLAVDPARGRLYWANDRGLWTSPTSAVVPAPLLEGVSAPAMADDGGERLYWMVASPFGWDAVEGIAWLPKP
jgi:hypothetical protein